jgi:origin recognition complex subunit 4
LNTVEIINEIQEFFNQNRNLCVLFILEDIDYYIQTTKQIMLYKILDMLQYANIPFVFVATSQKVDIVDSFEKRIKSRFSHR